MCAQLRLTETNRSISGILKESWSLVYGFKLPVMVVSSLIVAFIFMNGLMFFILSYTLIFNIEYFMANYPSLASFQGIYFMMFVIDIFIGVFVWFILAMLIMLGVRRALAQSIDLSLVFNDCKSSATRIFVLYLIIAALMLAMLSIRHLVRNLGVGGELICMGWLIFSTYIGLSFSIFTIPLIVTKKYTKMTDAINAGFQMMNENWKKVIPVLIIMNIIVFLSAVLLLGGGLLWTLPMFFAATGICFRNAYNLRY